MDRDFKKLQLDRLAVKLAQKYQGMIDGVNNVLSNASLPFTAGWSAAVRIRQMNTTTREALTSMIEFCRVMTQEISYQQNVINVHVQIEQRHRALFYQNLATFRTRLASISNLLNAQTVNVLFNDPFPPGVSGDWQNALQLKLADNLGSGPLGPVVETERQMFSGLLDEIRRLHQNFVAHNMLLTDIYNLTGCFQPGGTIDSTATARADNMTAIVQSRRVREVQAFGPVALREISRLSDGPLLRVIQGALRLLEPYLNGTLDPARGALGAADAQIQLMRESRLLVLNEKQLWQDRQAAALTEIGGEYAQLTAVAAALTPTPQELLTRIMDQAGNNAAEGAFLAANWTLETVQAYWNVADPTVPPP